MATILNTTQVYAAADVVTHTNLNQIVGGTTFVAGDGGATDNTSLEVDTTSGSLQIKNDGVITAKLPDSTDKTDGVTLPKIQHIDTNKVLGRTSANEGDVEEIDFIIGSTGNTGLFFDNDDLLDNSDTVGGSATSGATQQSIKAYIDKLKPNISQLIFTETYENLNPNSQWLDFGTEANPFEVSITPRLGNSKLKFNCSIASNTNNASHQNFFKLQRRTGPESLTNDFADVTGSMGPVSGVRTQCSFTSSYPGQYSCSIDGMDYLDDPTYTQGDEITYRVQVWGITTVDIYINRAQSNADNIRVPSPISTAMIEEIYQ